MRNLIGATMLMFCFTAGSCEATFIGSDGTYTISPDGLVCVEF